MNVHAKSAIVILSLGIAGILLFRYGWPMVQERLQLETSDARDTKAKIVVGMDNWIGYFLLCSADMKKRMRAGGYLLQCEDDKADYAGRMQRLRNGELQFAVATIDSYVLNGAAKAFPGTIVAVIDESKGGDAIVAWKDRFATLEDLKKKGTVKIAFTPNSPSEHLLKAMAVHFDVAALRQRQGPWRIEANGSPDALETLMARKADVAVLWEPDVTRALANPGIAKLLGSEDTDKLIVDVLLVSRKFSQEKPEAVTSLLTEYFQVAKAYRENTQRLEQDVVQATRIPNDKVKTLLNGVAWASLSDNFQSWLGTGAGADGLADAIQSTVSILVDSGDFKDNPIPDRDPYRIINRQFVSAIYVKTVTGGAPADSGTAQSLERQFKPLGESAWSALKEVGTLKTLPVVFQSGTAELSLEGKQELDKAMENLRHYPNFRVVVKGHTAVRGNSEENKKLSQERAESVARYLQVTYSVDPHRLRIVGYGSEKPLPQNPGESERAYAYRLPRVELSLVSEVF
jgi:outer membrane protein OmpA-like peptidoglycan-associated protein/ABC-type nitrate/sulfonate/bicarbonate transport system substrate-binding protein